MVDLSICIVNWNVQDSLRECLQSIYRETQGISYEILVVDNGSRDGSVGMVRDHFPNVHLIVNTRNKGFAAANNQAVQMSKGRQVVFLNPDTVIQGSALSTMVKFMDTHPEAGAVGCKLLNNDGSIQHSLRRSPTFSIALFSSTILGRLPLFGGKTEDYKMKRFCFDKVVEVEATSGAALLVRRSVLNEVGLMDEGYFMFMEEVDLCERIRKEGYKIYFLPDAVITHLGGESRNQNPEGLMIIGLSSVMRYFTKFEGPKKTYLFKLVFKPLFLLGLGYEVILDFVSFLRYQTIKKDPSKSRKRLMKVERTFHFLKKDLGYFILKL